MSNSDEQKLMQYIEKFSTLFNESVRDLMAAKLSGLDESRSSSAGSTNGVFGGFKNVDMNKLMSTQMDFMNKQMSLWQSASQALMSQQLGAIDSVVETPRGDKRFQDEEWNSNPVYNYIKQAYLLNSEMLNSTLDCLDFEDAKAEERAKYFTRQYVSSVSPSNYVLTNPEVCREILQSNGESLVKGMQNFLADLEQSPIEALKITQTDSDNFVLGENLACTEGEVVFENDLLQLIHYYPKTKTVYPEPLLICPPFINKFYILDLDQKKSMVRWLLEKGHAVFMISWVNPDSSMAHKGFADYVQEGLLAAIDSVCAITGKDKINVCGWCIGGTLLATTAAYMKAIGDDRINRLSFLTTLLEFTEQGEIGNYLTPEMLPLLEAEVDRKGVFDGRVMAATFSMLRENSLFWSYFVNNYLKGKDPMPFDILHWNSDSTNLPAQCYKDYIRATYFGNKLCEPGGIDIAGVPIDLSAIEVPSYLVATVADHIVLWQGAYRSAQQLGGDKRFILAGSGHIAGVINPAEGGKYPHWSNSDMPEQAEQWLETAEEAAGSWWPDWHEWLKQGSGKRVAAWQPGSEESYPAIEPAPGRYVKVRI